VTDTQSSSTAQSTQSGSSQQAAGQGAGSTQTQESQAGTTQSTAGQGTQQTQAGQTQTQAQQRPEYIPESHWDATANKVKDDAQLAAHFNQIFARDAAAQSKQLSLPANPDAYKVELPTDFAAPQGTEFKIDAANPLWAQARAWAHENGLSQEAFAKGIALIAGDRIGTQQQVTAAHNAEVAKLGPAGPARVDACETFFKAYLSEAEGKQLMSRAFTASDVQIMEKLVGKITGQGGGSFRRNGSEPPEQPGKVTEAQWATMTPSQKWDYSRSHDQKQFQTVTGGRQ
jgi:hypothetical protein